MALETGTYISDLVVTNPTAADAKSQGDDHIRLLKSTAKNTWPNVTGACTATHTEFNYVTGVTSSIQGQFTTVQGQFTANGVLITALQTGKADLAGAVYTGTHDFTGAITTVAAPTQASHAATMLYVQQQAFAAVLPSQAGNAGRYITTNGTTASWADLSGGMTTTSGAVSITLTVASRQFQVVTMTADDQTVTLPDATTLSAGGPVFTIFNKGTKQFSVRNADGAFLVNVQAGQIITCYLYDKTTVAGFWAIGNETYAGGALMDYALSTALVINATTSNDKAIVALSPTTAVCAYRGVGTVMQVVFLTITNAAIIAQSPVNVNAVASTNPSIAVLTTGKLILTYLGTSGFPQAVVISVTGTTLTPNTVVTVNAVTGATLGTSVAVLSATQAIVTYVGASSFVQTSILDISGTGITPSGTPLVLNAVSSLYPCVCALSSTKALVVYFGTTQYSNYIVIDITGSTMTPGTAAAFNAVVGLRSTLLTLSTNKALYLYTSSGGQVGLHVMDVTGTTATPSALVTGEAGMGGSQVSLAMLSSTRVMAMYSSGTNVRAALVTITGSVPAIGANLMGTVTGNYIAAAGLTSTKAVLVYGGTSSFLNAQIIEKAE